MREIVKYYQGYIFFIVIVLEIILLDGLFYSSEFDIWSGVLLSIMLIALTVVNLRYSVSLFAVLLSFMIIFTNQFQSRSEGVEFGIEYDGITQEYGLGEVVGFVDKGMFRRYKLKTNQGYLYLEDYGTHMAPFGSECLITGKLALPRNIADSEFDYERYMFRNGLIGTLKYGRLECKAELSVIQKFLNSVDSSIVNYFESVYPEPEVSLAIGILLGKVRLFDENFESGLRITGTTHIIAASGYNIVIITNLIDSLSFLTRSKKSSAILKLLVIFAYTSISGFGVSLIRAATMFSIKVLLNDFLGYPVRPLNIIGFSGIAMLALNPFIAFDIGFQLSILATTGLMLIAVKPNKGLPMVVSLISIVLPSVTAFLFTLPIILYYFRELSLISIVVNIVLQIVMEFTLPMLLFTYLLSFFSSLLAMILGRIVYEQLAFFSRVVEFFSQYSSFVVEVHWLWSLVFLILFLVSIKKFGVNKFITITLDL